MEAHVIIYFLRNVSENIYIAAFRCLWKIYEFWKLIVIHGSYASKADPIMMESTTIVFADLMMMEEAAQNPSPLR